MSLRPSSSIRTIIVAPSAIPVEEHFDEVTLTITPTFTKTAIFTKTLTVINVHGPSTALVGPSDPPIESTDSVQVSISQLSIFPFSPIPTTINQRPPVVQLTPAISIVAVTATLTPLTASLFTSINGGSVASATHTDSSRSKAALIAASTTVSAIVLLGLFALLIWISRRRKRQREAARHSTISTPIPIAGFDLNPSQIHIGESPYFKGSPRSPYDGDDSEVLVISKKEP